MTYQEINTRIATNIMGEPKPDTFPYEWEVTFSNYLNGTPTLSKYLNWYVGHHYEDGDTQEWFPVNFILDPREAERVIEHVVRSQALWKDAVPYHLQLNSAYLGDKYRARFINSVSRIHAAWQYGESFAEVICKAALDIITIG